MTYYFMGGEDVDFSPIAGPGVSTSGPTFRAGYARCSLATGGGAWRVPASYGLTVTGQMWATFRLYRSFANVAPFITFNGPGDIAALSFWNDGTIRKTVAGVTTTIGTPTGGIAFNTLTKCDIYIDFSVTGSALLYFDGDLITNTGVADVTGGQGSFAGFDLSGVGNFFSEVMWTDHDTRSLWLVTLPPTGNGATNTWDVHSVSNVDGITFNDALTDQSGTAAQIDLYAVGALPTGNFGIDAVEVVTRGVTTASAPQNIQNMVRAGGSDYNSPSFLQTATFKRNAFVWDVNPNTSVNWTQADLGSGFNVGMESIT